MEDTNNLKERDFNGELGWKPEYSRLRVATWTGQGKQLIQATLPGAPHCLWEGNLVQSFWMAIWQQIIKILNMLMSFDPVIES